MEGTEKWKQELADLVGRIGERFVRAEARRRAGQYVVGLLSQVPRKNGWQLSEELGESNPYGMQQFLYRAKWEADEVRDDLQAYVGEHLGEEAGVLVVDETSFVKKGRHSVGVGVQYCGTVGQVTNCQVGVFVTYATGQGHTFLDRALYLPQSWTQDEARCQAAGVPEGVKFATKPALAQQMLARILKAGIPAGWVTGDSVYGSNLALRHWLEEKKMAYVLGISPKDTVLDTTWFPERISHLLRELPTAGWHRLSAGSGSKGERWYDWYWRPLYDKDLEGWQRGLLVRRCRNDPTKLTPYVCFVPSSTPLSQIVQVAGKRWSIEQCFQGAKQEVGFDEYEVRSWQGWYRHITLACLAHAFLTVLRAQGLDPLPDRDQKNKPLSQTSSLLNFKQKRGLISP